MKLSSLRVINHHKLDKSVQSARSHLKGVLSFPSDAFVLETCQRKVIAFSDPKLSYGDDLLKGTHAYEFLLRLVCGLESELQGETEILGQFRAAWSRFEKTESEQADFLSPWIQRILEDVKEIRANDLQNLGSQSYGSLVRKVLREGAVKTPGPQKVLLVGAGHLATEILPWLLSTVSGVENEVSVWNRSVDPLFNLKKAFNKINIINNDRDAEKSAWAQADHVVVCVPFSRDQDAERAQWWSQGVGTNRTLIHLGGPRGEAGNFLEGLDQSAHFLALDDVLNLQKAQDRARREQIQRAFRVCEEKAHLRSMGTGSLSLPHGWEDLAVFAS